MEKLLYLILFTLERLSALKEYELGILTEEEALKLLERITEAINKVGE